MHSASDLEYESQSTSQLNLFSAYFLCDFLSHVSVFKIVTFFQVHEFMVYSWFIHNFLHDFPTGMEYRISWFIHGLFNDNFKIYDRSVLNYIHSWCIHDSSVLKYMHS